MPRPLRLVTVLLAGALAALGATAPATASAPAPAAPAAPAPAAVARVSNTVDARCSFLTYRQPSDWYLPAGEPRGLVWLQHGFSRSNDRMADLAGRYADAGFVVLATTLPSFDIFGCTIQANGANVAFLNSVTDWFGRATDPSGALARSFADARSRAGRPGLALPARHVFAGHSAGAGVVSYAAQRLRSTVPDRYAALTGLVLLDPVGPATGLGAYLGALDATGLPIAHISSPAYSCNGNGVGIEVIRAALRRPWVGVQLTTGCHCDAEGASTDVLCVIACGAPQPQNVAALQTLAVNWAIDDVAGVRRPDYYPGGAYYDALVATGTIVSLPGTPARQEIR
jgi:hypothetical protein